MAAEQTFCHPQIGWYRWVPETHFRRGTLVPGLATTSFSTTSLWTAPPAASALRIPENSRTLLRSEKHLEKKHKKQKAGEDTGP